MSFDGIKVQHGHLDAGAADVMKAAKDIEARLTQLENELNPLKSVVAGKRLVVTAEESAAMVFTHGRPWCRDSDFSTSAVLRALLKPNEVSANRMFAAFGSCSANAVVAVHGSGGLPPGSATTGPYRVHHWVRVTGAPPLTATVTVRFVIRSRRPSTR